MNGRFVDCSFSLQDVAQVTDFRIDPSFGTTSKLTFQFQKPAGLFSQLLLCHRNNELTETFDRDVALRKNTLRCDVLIPNNVDGSFTHSFNISPTQLEYGNLYEFKIRTKGCEETTKPDNNTKLLCEVDSESRQFQMGMFKEKIVKNVQAFHVCG